MTLSVTQVLGRYSDLWKIPEDRLEKARNRGSEVHKYCATIAKGLWVPPASIPPEYLGYIRSFMRWMTLAVEEVILVEQQITCDCQVFSGTPDLVVILKGEDGLRVVDIKTPITEGPLWRGQLGAYWHLVEDHASDLIRQNCPRFATRIDDNGRVPVVGAGALMLSPEGKMARLREYRHQYEDFAAFIAGLVAARYFSGERYGDKERFSQDDQDVLLRMHGRAEGVRRSLAGEESD